MSKPGRYGLILLGAAAAGVAAAFLLAIVLGIVDLYLSGHSRPTLSRQWIDVPEWGISLSRADVILLAGALVSSLAAGIALAARSGSQVTSPRD